MTISPISTALFHSGARADMHRLGSDIAQLQGEIAQGVKDTRPSGDLLGALRLSAAETRESAIIAYADNARYAANRLDQADAALEEATNLVRRVRDVALQGLSDTTTADMRTTIAAEVRVLREALIGVGNTRDSEGRMLFSGTATQTEPFADVGGRVTYAGASSLQQLAISEARVTDTGISGREAFGVGSATGSFETIDAFLSLLESGDGAAPPGVTRESVLDGLDAALDTLIASRTRVGTLSASATQQAEVLVAQQTDIAVLISELEDLDLADAITRLQEALLTRDAAQQTYVQISQRSLFDYLR